jgi:phosphatidylserine decarboxylase
MSMKDTFASVLVPIHRAGWPFVAIALGVALALAWLASPLGLIGLGLAGFVAFFFRDPARVVPIGEDLVVSPADGAVAAVRPRRPPPELELGDSPRTCISIFLSVLDVHVNRTPVGGRVLVRAYHPGRFLNAALDKASEANERQSFLIERPDGARVGVVQIAGLVARRILGFVEAGAVLEPGQRIGLIRFGSRVDVYLPDGTVPLVAPGQRAIGGETVLADARRNRPPTDWRRD